jgi:hypothetical protein
MRRDDRPAVLSVMTHVLSGCVVIPISMSIPTQSPCHPQAFLLSHVFVASIFMCGPEVGRASRSFLPLTRTSGSTRSATIPCYLISASISQPLLYRWEGCKFGTGLVPGYGDSAGIRHSHDRLCCWASQGWQSLGDRRSKLWVGARSDSWDVGARV